MIEPIQDDISYTAGYFDGDAYFYKRNGSVGIEVTSTNLDVLLYFRDHFGGSFGTHSPRIDKPNWKPEFIYYIQGLEAIKLCQKLQESLIEKRTQAMMLCDKTISEKDFYEEKHNSNLIYKDQKEILLPLKKTKIPTIQDFVYLAGFIDAECSLRIISSGKSRGNNPSYKIYLICNNTKIPIFVWLIERFGGNLYFVDRKTKNSKWRDQFQWYLSSKSLYEILPHLYPYLKFKKAVCQKLIEFHECGFSNGGDRHSDKYKIAFQHMQTKRISIIQEVHFLNRKGKNPI